MLKRLRFFLAPLLILLGTSVVLAKGAEKDLSVYDFSKGLDSFHSSLSLPDGFVQDAQNVYFDRSAPVEKRQGYTVAFSTQAFSYQAAWSYTDGTNTSWIIVRSSNQITASNLAGSKVVIATTSANNLVSEVNSQGNAYFVDQTQGVYYWNGSATSYVSGSPKGSLITQFHGRIWVAGSAVPNGNQLYGSKYLDGTTWATGLNPNDPVQLTVGLTDNFDNITALYPFLDTLYTPKHYSIYALYGFDQTTFQVSFITSECGCIDGQSIQSFNHGLYFMSLRGIEFFNGYTCQRVSDPIKNKVDPAILSQGGINTQSWVQSQTADWNAGSFTNVSSSVTPPSLVLSTNTAFSGNDSTQANWQAGTLTNLDATTNPPYLQLLKSSPSDVIQSNTSGSSDATWCTDFSMCTTGQNDMAQSFTTSSGNQQLTSIKLALFRNGSPGNTTLRLKNDNSGSPGSDIATTIISQSSIGSFAWYSFPLSANLSPSTKYWIYIDHVPSTSNSNEYGWGDSLPQAGDAEYRNCTCLGGPTTAAKTHSYKVHVQPVYSASGSITSRVFDIGATTNTWLFNWNAFNTSETDNGQTITYQTQVSSSSTGPWDSPVSVAPGGTIGSASKRYLQYVASFATSNLTVTPILSSVTVNTSAMEAPTGTFTSQAHATGSISSFGNFSVQNVLNSGTMAFSVCSSASSNMSSRTCAAQTPNSQIILSTNAYVAWSTTFTATNVTQVPALNSVTMQWYSGNLSPSMASTIWDNRYYLALSTTSTDNFNDAVIVMGQNNVFSIFNIPVGGFTQYKGSLYHADALPTGNIYLDNQGYSDNGNPINAYIKTKDLSMGNLTEDDFIDSIWPSMDNLGNYNVYVNYFVDRAANPYQLGTINQSEFLGNAAVKLPFPLDLNHQAFGKTLSFMFQAADANEPWKFYGFREIYHERPTQ